MTVTTLHVSSEAITYAAAVIFCEFADLELITYAAAVISADSQFWIRPLTPQQWSLRRQCPSQVEDDHLRRSSGLCGFAVLYDHLRRSSGRCEQALPVAD